MGNPDHEYINNTNSPHRVVPFGTARTTGTGPDELVQAPPSYVITEQVIVIGHLICSAIFLLLFIIYNYLHHHHRRRRLADLRQLQLFFSNRAESSPCRLDQNIIDSIPVTKLSLHGDDKVSESCAVCISTARTPGTGTDTGPDEFVQAPLSYVITEQGILIGLLICSAIFLLLFIIYGYLRHHRRRTRLPDLRQPRLLFSNRAESSPRRLDQNIIDSIPVIKLSLHGDDKVSESCAVCISEFTHGEKLRALPQCGHRFHLECIDMWFASHSTCPLCRADVNSSSPNSDQQVVYQRE